MFVHLLLNLICVPTSVLNLFFIVSLHLCLDNINSCGCVFMKERIRSERYIAVALPVYDLFRMSAVKGLSSNLQMNSEKKIKNIFVGMKKECDRIAHVVLKHYFSFCITVLVCICKCGRECYEITKI